MKIENETELLGPNRHIGIKIGGARRLIGISQKELGNRLGISEQEASKLEQLTHIEDGELAKVAFALGVSFEGLKNFQTEGNLYYTNNFYENCGVSATNGGLIATARVENNNHFSIEQALKLFEELGARGLFNKLNEKK